MLNEGNIMDIISEHEKDISDLESALKDEKRPIVVNAIKSKLNFLEDNVYRYRLQAKAWGLI